MEKVVKSIWAPLILKDGKKSFWETLKFWKNNSKFAFHPEFLYRPVIIDFNQKTVNVFDKKPQLVNGENQYNGFVLGTLKRFGKYVYLAAFDSGLKCGDYQRVCLDDGVEDLAFHAEKSVFDTFLSNFENLDWRSKNIYFKDFVGNYPENKNFLLQNHHFLTFREAKYEKFSVNSYDSKLWLWVVFDAEGNVLDPHEYAFGKPYEYMLKYEYVSASRKYLYNSLDYSNDILSVRQERSFIGGVFRKSTGEIFGLLLGLTHMRYGPGYKEFPLTRRDMSVFLNDEEIIENLEYATFRLYPYSALANSSELFRVTNGELVRFMKPFPSLLRYLALSRIDDRGLCLKRDKHWGYFNFDEEFEHEQEWHNSDLGEIYGENYWYNPDLGEIHDGNYWNDPDFEMINPETYWQYPKIAHFTTSENYKRFFVCGMMRQKSTDKIFYLVADFLCECKENGLFLSPEDLQTLLKDDNVAEQFEGKSFWDFKKKCYMSITDRKLHEKSKPDGKSHFVLRDENGVIFDEKFKPSDWELIFPQAEKTA